ncbi:hypothetical protein PIIN_09610 [Serendipita indica DSM 11827]|uniref:Uncharacterized protein n=1 Tax=Serendipita indica (strain DSM 11827) TaxID=1109443 RepID=G4TWC6_SERID|nr:hypothetical protein PIIN_09610 [Serendipita indica DSM 11827]
MSDQRELEIPQAKACHKCQKVFSTVSSLRRHLLKKVPCQYLAETQKYEDKRRKSNSRYYKKNRLQLVARRPKGQRLGSHTHYERVGTPGGLSTTFIAQGAETHPANTTDLPCLTISKLEKLYGLTPLEDYDMKSALELEALIHKELDEEF